MEAIFPICIPQGDAVYLRVAPRAGSSNVLAGVISTACIEHGVTEADIRGRCRQKRIAAARHDCWYLLHLAGWSYPELGREFGVDQSTARSGAIQAEKRRRGQR